MAKRIVFVYDVLNDAIAYYNSAPNIKREMVEVYVRGIAKGFERAHYDTSVLVNTVMDLFDNKLERAGGVVVRSGAGGTVIMV